MFENVKAKQRQTDPSYIVMWGGSGPEATAQCSGPESAAELTRRLNLFPELVKALEKAASVMDMEGLIEAEDLQALLREAKE